MSRSPVRRMAATAADRLADALAWRLATRYPTPGTAPVACGAPTTRAESQELDAGAEREGKDNRHLELLLGWLLRHDSNCIDVGAHEGRFLSHMVNRSPDGQHLAWEPIPHLAQQARKTFPTVDVHEAALSNRTGESTFVYVPELPGYSGLRERSYPAPVRTESITVRLERLDEALPVGYRPDLIKIDVEGAEREVIEGGLKTISQHRPVVVFEHGLGASDRYGTTPEQVWDLLAVEARLRIYDMDAVGPMSRGQFADTFASASRWNYVAMP